MKGTKRRYTKNFYYLCAQDNGITQKNYGYEKDTTINSGNAAGNSKYGTVIRDYAVVQQT